MGLISDVIHDHLQEQQYERERRLLAEIDDLNRQLRNRRWRIERLEQLVREQDRAIARLKGRVA